jgi:hypothetical protein
MKLLSVISIVFITTTTVADSFDSVLDLHASKQFDSSIDSGGNVGVSRYGAELRLNYHLTDEDDLQLRFQYQRDDWNFSGTTGLGNDDPWDLVTTTDIALQWTHQWKEKTQLFGGPIIKWSEDSGASQSNSKVFGGMFGIAHVYSDTLVLGGGVGFIETLGDDDRFFPIIVLDWKIKDRLTLRSDLMTRFGNRIGVELVWTPRDDWSLGAGLSYDYSRFRLDDVGIAPGGVGEATSLPLTLRASYHPSDNVDITIFGGVVFGGELSVYESTGLMMQTESYDSAGAVGILARIRF